MAGRLPGHYSRYQRGTRERFTTATLPGDTTRPAPQNLDPNTKGPTRMHASRDQFFARLRSAILTSPSCACIGRDLGIRSETVRRRRSSLGATGHAIGHPWARRKYPRGYDDGREQ